MGLYAPVLMSVIYDRAKWSGSAYRFHFAAEAGWDMGAGMGCILAAFIAWGTQIPSLSVLPAMIGISRSSAASAARKLRRGPPKRSRPAEVSSSR
jgi:hypothetical protein